MEMLCKQLPACSKFKFCFLNFLELFSWIFLIWGWLSLQMQNPWTLKFSHTLHWQQVVCLWWLGFQDAPLCSVWLPIFFTPYHLSTWFTPPFPFTHLPPTSPPLRSPIISALLFHAFSEVGRGAAWLSSSYSPIFLLQPCFLRTHFQGQKSNLIVSWGS